MIRVAITKTDLFFGEMPVFYFNPDNEMYEHIYGNGKHRLFYEREHVEEDDRWMIFDIDREEQEYIKIKGDW